MQLRKIIFVCGVLSAAAALFSQQKITKVAVVNYSIISQAVPASFGANDTIAQKKAEYDAQVAQYNQAIQALYVSLAQAQSSGSQNEVDRYTNAINKQKLALKKYVQTKGRKLLAEIQSSSFGQSRSAIIRRAVAYVAESSGASIVFDSQDPNLLWFTKDVDITQKVVSRIKAVISSHR